MEKKTKAVLAKVVNLIKQSPGEFLKIHYPIFKGQTKTVGPLIGACGIVTGFTEFADLQYFMFNEDQRHVYFEKFLATIGLSKQQALKLSCLQEWPEEYRESLFDANDSRKKARVVVDRIQHFLEHGE